MANLLAPPQIAETSVEVSVAKARKTSLQLFLLAVMAGAFIALAGYAATMAAHTVPAANYGLSRFIQGAVFPLGLILVLIAGAELFTGNTLMVIGVFEGQVTWSEMLHNWLLVYVGNFGGSLLFAWAISASGLLASSGGALGAMHVSIAAAKTALPFGQALVRGILANFAVCLAVWMAMGAKDATSKVLVVWFPIMAFVLGGFEHSIANMYYIPVGIFVREGYAAAAGVTPDLLTWGGLIKNLIPVTLGNILGGSGFVAGVYWASYKRNNEVKNRPPSSLKSM